MRWIFPNNLYRFKAIKRYSPLGPNDTDWSLGMLVSGQINLTTFGMSVTPERLQVVPTIIGPWLQTNRMAFFVEDTFLEEPQIRFPRPLVAFVGLIFLVQGFVRLLLKLVSKDREEMIGLHVMGGWIQTLTKATCESLVVIMFVNFPAPPEVRNSRDLLREMEHHKDVKILYNLASKRRQLEEQPGSSGPR